MNTKVSWYYKDNNDEFEMYGYDEQIYLEDKWQHFMHGNGDQYQSITCGYFANCAARHIVDFVNWKQFNIDSNESRNIIRALPNHQLNSNPVHIASAHHSNSDNVDKQCHYNYDALKRNLEREEDCGGDAVIINIPSINNEIVNDTFYSNAKQHDIPIVTAFVDSNDDETIDNVLDSFGLICDSMTMDIINLYSMRLKMSSSMISYLISQQKCNFILYNTDFELLAVGKYHGSYIHKYNMDVINPYRYQSFIDFYSVFTSFCHVASQYNLKIRSLISSFNTNVRICVMYDKDNDCAQWTHSIYNRQAFKENIQMNQYQIALASFINNEDCDDSDDCDDCDESIIECSVCYKRISNPSQCFDHKDLCNSCLLHWRQSGHDSCPKCGTSHLHLV